MPSWLWKQLEQGAKVTTFNRLNPDGRLVRVEQIANETRGIIPVLSQLCDQDRTLSRVYLCHPDVQHVVKMAKEGGFCGYRNIQMMVRLIPNCDPSSTLQDLGKKQLAKVNPRYLLFRTQEPRATSISQAGFHRFSNYKI